ncbi:MAG: His/Gly/Thr/Pro-type tRNA ligase C-terminal domain-containing protein, partial [Anaerolineae bacterium]|nr:His/Gly/Thr/Pro-type tRNA ligase C-terminal domain-containing protein [Anaerolineae bacterium]
ATLRGYLDALGMPHTINFRLVRGLDYYTKTVFEAWAEGIGAQAAVCGGGRYDGLIEELGGPPTPGIGFGMGIERVIASLKQQGVQPPPLPAPRVQVLPLGEAARVAGLKLVRELRDADIGALISFGNRSLKAQLKSADKQGVTYALILGDQELDRGVVTVRHMTSSQQEDVPLGGVAQWLRERIL